MKQRRFVSDWVLKSRCNPELVLDLAVPGQCGLSCGILIGMLYSALLSRTPGVGVVTWSPPRPVSPVSYFSWHRPPPRCWLLRCRAPVPRRVKVVLVVTTPDPWYPIRAQVSQLWTNDSAADSLRCDAGYYVWCLGVSQTRHKSYRSHNKEDGINILRFFPFLSTYFQAGNIILFCKYLLSTKTQDLNDIYVFAINNKY